MIVTTRQLYEQAYGTFAPGAYNVNNIEQVLGLLDVVRSALAAA